MKHNEDTRVKLPAILHLIRLGYTYLSLKDTTWDEPTNIFPNLFKSAMLRINPELEDDAIYRLFQDVSLALENEDLGQAFYDMLMTKSGTKLIDWDDFDNNTFHVVTELTYKNGDEEFRPDIILLINGMPLVFIEVKKPNNPDGVLAERKRINHRFANRKFRKFVNLTQIMMFSDLIKKTGAYFSTFSYN